MHMPLEYLKKKSMANIALTQHVPQSSSVTSNAIHDALKKKVSITKGKQDNAYEDEYDAEEKKRRQVYQEEQELRSFQERGGFNGVLRDLFRPAATGLGDLDSVHQLQNLCSGYYQKK